MSHPLPPSKLQFDSEGKLHHFLTIEGLKRQTLTEILDLAESFWAPKGLQLKNSRCCAEKPWSTSSLRVAPVP